MPVKFAARKPLQNVDNPWVQQDWAYYRDEVKPLLSHPLVEFVGELDDDDKGQLLKDARALLFPINWPEPFGLAMVEALACGTPVIASPRGSVPEVIRHGRTGFICATVEEMVAACRDHGAQALHLEVLSNNQRAIEFYIRTGFQYHGNMLMSRLIRS